MDSHERWRRHPVRKLAPAVGLAVLAVIASHNVGWAIGLGIAGGLWFIGATMISLNNAPFIQRHMPTLQWLTDPPHGILVRAKTGSSSKKLKENTLEIVADINAYLSARASPLEAEMARIRSRVRLSAPTTEEEAREMGVRFLAESRLKSESERREIIAHFGGRIRYVVTEFARRGMVEKTERARMEWAADNLSGLGELAVQLQALALRL
jgi:hypothetical protein